MNKIYKDPKIGISTTDFKQPKDYDESVFNLTGTEYSPAEEDTTIVNTSTITFE
jgi:hypothetical protein